MPAPHYVEISSAEIITWVVVAISAVVIAGGCVATMFRKHGQQDAALALVVLTALLSLIVALVGRGVNNRQIAQEKYLEDTLELQKSGQTFYLHSQGSLIFTTVSKDAVNSLKARIINNTSTDVRFAYDLKNTPLKILSISVDKDNAPKNVFVENVSDPGSVFSMNASSFLDDMRMFYSAKEAEKPAPSASASEEVDGLMKEVNASRSEFNNSH